MTTNSIGMGRHLPDALKPAYEWIDAAGEWYEAVQNPEEYARGAYANAVRCEQTDVFESDLVDVIEWYRDHQTLDSYRVFLGRESQQVRLDGSNLDPHAWYYEPLDYDGDVVFDAGFATRDEALHAARNHALDAENQSFVVKPKVAS